LISKTKEFSLIIRTINDITKNSKYTVSLKIHPSTASYKEFSTMLKNNNLQIPLYQKEDLIELVSSHDVMLTYGDTSAAIFGIGLRKPVLFLNYFSDDSKPQKNVYHLSDITMECNNPKELRDKINETNSKSILEKQAKKYLTEFLGTNDGKSSLRIAEIISSVIKKSFS